MITIADNKMDIVKIRSKEKILYLMITLAEDKNEFV